MTQVTTVSALEAARLLGVNERTVRTWVDQERIKATKIPHQRRLHIPMSEIERIQAERAEQEQLADLPTVRQIHERVNALATDTTRAAGIVNKHDTELESQLQHLTDHDRKINAQEQRIAELERQVQAQAAQIATLLEQIQSGSRPRTARRQRSTAQAGDSGEAADHAGLAELEPGLVGASDFADLHKINIGTAKSAFQAGRVPSVEGRWRGPGRQPIRRALAAEGRRRFWELYHDYEVFEDCPDCPHKLGNP